MGARVNIGDKEALYDELDRPEIRAGPSDEPKI